MKIQKITPIKFQRKPKLSKISFQKQDTISFENKNVDKKVFIKNKIISQDENINSFFGRISNEIFENESDRVLFCELLKEGKISLSSSAYRDLKNPQSAIALCLDKNNGFINNCSFLDKYINRGLGVGINFSNFENPSSEIKKINSYFKFRSSSSLRPNAGIALLDIRNKDILDFISLKEKKDYENWCFDLSVIIDDKFLNEVDNDSTIILSDGQEIKARSLYDKLLNSMLKTGEPGIIFSNNKNYICDCCGTCELKENECLTLGQINLSKLIKNSKFNFSELKKSAKIIHLAMQKLDKNSYIGILGYQDMLNKLNIKYGSNEALSLLEEIIKTIKAQEIKIAISPTGTISRFLKTTPSIEPDKKTNYIDDINTVSVVQNLIEGQVSKTILLSQDTKIEDVDKIIRYSKQKGLKGICVFR